MNNKAKKITCLLLSLLIALFIYTLLHESGHMIVMLSAGVTITEFSILTAHVSGVGGNYSGVSWALGQINGALLPVIVSFAYIALYKRENKNSFYRFFSFYFSLISISSLLTWVIVPFLYMQGKAPAYEDAARFLVVFTDDNYHPLLVSAAAFLIIVLGAALMIKKGIIKNYIEEVRGEHLPTQA